MKKSAISVLIATALLGTASLASAQATSAPTPAQKYAAESKELSARYQSDLKICSGEAESAGRMQCKRDAKAQYDKSLAEAKARMTAAVPATAKSAAMPACADCGTVSAVTAEERQGEGSPVGMIAGGVVGGLLGHQVGGGTGKDLATIAGAAGGAYAGREVEKRVTKKTVWVVKVNFGAAGTHAYEFAQDPGFRVGDTVKKSGNSVARP